MCQDLAEYDPFETIIYHEGWGEYEEYIYVDPMTDEDWEEWLDNEQENN